MKPYSVALGIAGLTLSLLAAMALIVMLALLYLWAPRVEYVTVVPKSGSPAFTIQTTRKLEI